MFPYTKQKQKSDQNDMVSALSSLSMPSLTPTRQLPMTKSFEMRRNSSLLMRHKTPAETISETRRMLSNGTYILISMVNNILNPHSEFHFKNSRSISNCKKKTNENLTNEKKSRNTFFRVQLRKIAHIIKSDFKMCNHVKRTRNLYITQQILYNNNIIFLTENLKFKHFSQFRFYSVYIDN